MKHVNNTSRRTFLRQAGTVAAAPYIISATALGARARRRPAIALPWDSSASE